MRRRDKGDLLQHRMTRYGTFSAQEIAGQHPGISIRFARRLCNRMERDGMLEGMYRDPESDRPQSWRLTPSGHARIQRGTAG